MYVLVYVIVCVNGPVSVHAIAWLLACVQVHRYVYV